MKIKPQIRFCAMVMAVVMAAGSPLAQAASYSTTVSQQVRREMVIDHNKRVLTGADSQETAPVPAAPAANPYAQEGAQMAMQLQVIADNEDINYTIIEGDTLTVSFKDRDQQNRAVYKVSSTGEIHMPLLGPVKVAGLNRKQARERVDMMLKDYIRDPRAHIAINTDGRIMIFGAVGTPGLYTITPKMSVMEAIFTAGGFLRQSAEMASVVVIRGPVSKPTVLKLNLKKMMTKGDRSDDILVKPGDFIYIPTSLISNLDKFWNMASSLLIRWYSWIDLREDVNYPLSVQ